MLDYPMEQSWGKSFHWVMYLERLTGYWMEKRLENR